MKTKKIKNVVLIFVWTVRIAKMFVKIARLIRKKKAEKHVCNHDKEMFI